MNVKALVALESALHGGMFMSGIVVHDEMNLFVLGGAAVQ